MNDKAKKDTGQAQAQSKKLLCCGINQSVSGGVGQILDDWFDQANAGLGGPVADIDSDPERAALFYQATSKIDEASRAMKNAQAELVALDACYVNQQKQ